MEFQIYDDLDVSSEPSLTDAAQHVKVGFSPDGVYQINGRLLDTLYMQISIERF